MPDAAGRSMDQHALAALQAAMADKALPGGQTGQRQRAGMIVVNALRLRCDFIGRGHSELRIGRGLLGKTRHAEHGVTDPEAAIDAWAYRLDRT